MSKQPPSEHVPSDEDRRQCPVCRTGHARPHCDEQVPAVAVIGLTETQAIVLKDHLAYGARQSNAGQPGAVVAQVYNKFSDHSRPGFANGCMRVTFFERERAELMTEAGYARVKSQLAERDELLQVLKQILNGPDPDAMDLARALVSKAVAL